MSKLNTLKPRVGTVDTRSCQSPVADRIRGHELQRKREQTVERYGYKCNVCGRLVDLPDGEVDHIVPLHLGGAESDENRQWLCRACHKAKSEQEERGRNDSSS